MIADSLIVPECVYRPGSFTGLMTLYESNYIKLSQLIKGLDSFPAAHEQIAVSSAAEDCDLYLTVKRRRPYTTTLRLTYRFPSGANAVRERSAADLDQGGSMANAVRERSAADPDQVGSMAEAVRERSAADPDQGGSMADTVRERSAADPDQGGSMADAVRDRAPADPDQGRSVANAVRERTVADPDLWVHVYHDARLVEARCPSAELPPSPVDGCAPDSSRELGWRWHNNMLLNKWLDYLLARGHRFSPRRPAAADIAPAAPDAASADTDAALAAPGIEPAAADIAPAHTGAAT